MIGLLRHVRDQPWNPQCTKMLMNHFKKLSNRWWTSRPIPALPTRTGCAERLVQS